MSANLNPDEVSALMSAIEEGRLDAPQAPARAQAVPYDLTSRDRLLRGQMPALDSIHEQIASAFGTGLSGRTRLPLRVEPSPGSLVPLADLGLLLAPPATVCILSLGMGGAEAVVILDPGLAESLVAASLGDRNPGEGAAERRSLTPVGKLILRKLLGLLATSMGQAWAPYLPLRPEVLRVEVDPRLALSINPGGDVAVLTSFGLSGPITGRIQLAIPYTAIQPAKRLLDQVAATPRAHKDHRLQERIAAEVEATEVDLQGILGRTTLTIAQLLELDEGDLLPLSTDEANPLPLLVGGREKLSGFPLVVRGALAMKLVRAVGRSTASSPADADKQHLEIT